MEHYVDFVFLTEDENDGLVEMIFEENNSTEVEQLKLETKNLEHNIETLRSENREIHNQNELLWQNLRNLQEYIDSFFKASKEKGLHVVS